MTTWVCFPSAAPLAQARLCVLTWQSQGYKVAIAAEDGRTIGADWAWRQNSYPGYAASVNLLAKAIMWNDPGCRAIVIAADDLFPDAKRKADEIEADLAAKHGELYVVQGVGDRWTLPTSDVPQSERVAGSPWVSREWVRRSYMGNGPLWAEYVHCWEDNDLMEVASMLGVFHQDASITHRHEHFLRHGRSVPPHAEYAYSKYADDQAIFERRKAEGFPESGLLP